MCNTEISSDLWLHTVLSVIGGMYGDHHSEVCGAVAALRRSKRRDRVNLWLRTTDKAACMKIG